MRAGSGLLRGRDAFADQRDEIGAGVRAAAGGAKQGIRELSIFAQIARGGELRPEELRGPGVGGFVLGHQREPRGGGLLVEGTVLFHDGQQRGERRLDVLALLLGHLFPRVAGVACEYRPRRRRRRIAPGRPARQADGPATASRRDK